jgi:hypothetical protein
VIYSHSVPLEWDFFVSYTQVDRRWAEWIAWTMEAAGYRVLIQAWDMVPGTNWVFAASEGMQRAQRTIAVLSRAYLESEWAQLESLGALHRDPLGRQRRLLAVRVEDFRPWGPLGMITHIDVFSLPEADALRALLDGVEQAISGRGKPDAPRGFPGQGREARFPHPSTGVPGAVQRRTCLALDVDDYRRSDPALREHVRGRLLDMLHSALERAGVRNEACEVVDRIDGLALILPAGSTAPAVTAALVTELCTGVVGVGRAVPREAAIRLRVGVAAGPVDLGSWTFEGPGTAAALHLATSIQVRTAAARFGRTPNSVVVADDLYQEAAAGAGGMPAGFSRIPVSEAGFGWIMLLAASSPAHAASTAGDSRAHTEAGMGAAAMAGMVTGGLAAEAWTLLHEHPDDPVADPHVGDPHVGEPHVGEPHVGEPHVGEPHVGEPHVGEPHVGEPPPEADDPSPANPPAAAWTDLAGPWDESDETHDVFSADDAALDDAALDDAALDDVSDGFWDG